MISRSIREKFFLGLLPLPIFSIAFLYHLLAAAGIMAKVTMAPTITPILSGTLELMVDGDALYRSIHKEILEEELGIKLLRIENI